MMFKNEDGGILTFDYRDEGQPQRAVLQMGGETEVECLPGSELLEMSLDVGDDIYLVAITLDTGYTGYGISSSPQTKNLNHEECVSGWLGTTNGVNRQAIGHWRIVDVDGDNLHIERLDL